MDKAIHWINFNPADNAIVSPDTYLLDSDLSGRWPYRTFEQPGPEMFLSFAIDIAINYPINISSIITL